MQLQYSNEADVPQEAKDSFVPFEQGGATVFMHKDLAEQTKATYRNQGQLTELSKKFDSFQADANEKASQAQALAEAKATWKLNAND